jgi:dTDP-glucose 4,6-dehydratase
MTQERVLLTGAAGLLGSHALRYLLDNTDWDIVCPVSFRHRGVPERLNVALSEQPQWQTDRVTVIMCDLATPINDTTATLFGDVNYIINFASDSYIIRSVEQPTTFIQNNVNLMLYLTEWARTLPNLHAFVQVSTDEVYGPARNGSHVEWSTYLPSSPYSASKVAQEAIAISYWRTYGLPMIIINSMNLFGESQDPEKFIPSLISKIYHGDTVLIHVATDGRIGMRTYLHARELASAILFLLRRGHVARPQFSERPDRWNVVGDAELDNLQLARRVAEFTCRPLNYRTVTPSVSGHAFRYALDGAKIASVGWTQLRSFDVSLEAMVNWTLKNPLWLNRHTRSTS